MIIFLDIPIETCKFSALRGLDQPEDITDSFAPNLLTTSLALCFRDEFLRNHHDWLDKLKPKLGKGISGKVRASYELTSSTHLVPTAKRVREEVRAAFSDLLKVSLVQHLNAYVPSHFCMSWNILDF